MAVIFIFGSKQSNYFDKIWNIVFYIFMYSTYIYIYIYINIYSYFTTVKYMLIL